MKLTEYQTLKEAFAQGKGNFTATVKSLGETKSGKTSDGKDYVKQDVTLTDGDVEEKITLWGEDIGKLKLNVKYDIENPWWKEYKGKPQVSLGNFCKLHIADGVQESMDDAIPEPKINPIDGSVSTPQPKDLYHIELSGENTQTAMKLVSVIRQIEIVVENELSRNPTTGAHDIEVNPAKVGMYVKFLIDLLFPNGLSDMGVNEK